MLGLVGGTHSIDVDFGLQFSHLPPMEALVLDSALDWISSVRASDALVAFVLGLVVTLAVTPIVVLYLCRADLFDSENERSSHSGRIPRGGGLAIVIAAAAAVVYSLVAASDSNGLAASAGCALVFALLGFVDDHHSLSAPIRLACQIALAAAFVALFQPLAVDAPAPLVCAGEILWIVGFVNVFNFMDGINGISSMTSAIVGGTIAVASLAWGSGGAALLAAAITGASIGFLPSNFPNAKVFLGDVGSYGIGAALAVTALMSADGGPDHGSPPGLRPLRGRCRLDPVRSGPSPSALLSAHRDHVYQRLANGGWGHERTTLTVGALTALLSVVGLAIGQRSLLAQLVGVVIGLAVVVTYLVLPARA
ncbi:MAG: hypothetical protein R2733_00155 [Acidimicrobiales bacterium]